MVARYVITSFTSKNLKFNINFSSVIICGSALEVRPPSSR